MRYLLIYEDHSGCCYEGDRPEIELLLADKPYYTIKTKYSAHYVNKIFDLVTKKEIIYDYNLTYHQK